MKKLKKPAKPPRDYADNASVASSSEAVVGSRTVAQKVSSSSVGNESDSASHVSVSSASSSHAAEPPPQVRKKIVDIAALRQRTQSTPVAGLLVAPPPVPPRASVSQY